MVFSLRVSTVHRMFRSPSLPGLILLLAFAPAVLSIAPAVAEEPDQKAERLVRAMDRQELPGIWTLASEVQSIGVEAIPAVKRASETVKDPGKLGCAKVLLSLGEGVAAVDLLRSVLDSSESTDVRVAALGLFEQARGVPSVTPFLLELLEDSYEPRERIAIAKTVWAVTTSGRARSKVRTELLRASESDNEDIRFEAALALAHIGLFEKARKHLKVLRKEPSVRGQLAQNYLDLYDLSRQLERGGAIRIGDGAEEPKDPAHEFVDDILGLIDDKHYAAADVDREQLLEGAARGMLKTLDPYSTYFSAEQWKKWNFDLNPNYGGIGAYVNFIDGIFTIIRPIYSGPAYKLGLRSNDQILKVDGWSTRGQDLEEITRRLKGPAGKPVDVSVYRKGWAKPRTMEIVRDSINIPTSKGELLPGGIGYTRLDTFGGSTAEELNSILAELRRDGMRALVLDLRDNFGGYLSTAEKVADIFLPEGKLVVEWENRDKQKESYITHVSSPNTDYPMIVLINRNSASASEIVSGALKDHGRATLVGVKSYGKGSVQNVVEVPSRPKERFYDTLRKNGVYDDDEPFRDENGDGKWNYPEVFEDLARRNGRWDPAEEFDDANGNGVYDEEESFSDANRDGKFNDKEPFSDTNDNGRYDLGPMVKLTIAKWFLPVTKSIDRKYSAEGKLIERGGVIPDHKVKPDTVAPWKIEELQKMREASVFENYLDEHFDSNVGLFSELAVYDGFDASRYPDFDEFFESLDTPVKKDDVRRWLKMAVQRRVQDVRGREFIEDYQNDAALQKALLVLLGELGQDPAEVDAYSFIPDLVAAREEKAKDDEDWEDEFE